MGAWARLPLPLHFSGWREHPRSAACAGAHEEHHCYWVTLSHLTCVISSTYESTVGYFDGFEFSYHCHILATSSSLRGEFHEEHFRSAYVSFMTTPGSHNDAYASTCHRMFFANMVNRKLPPVDCPDNDKHNVDTIDGLVLPSVTALAMAAREASSQEQKEAAARTVAVTRNSPMVRKIAKVKATSHLTNYYSTSMLENTPFPFYQSQHRSLFLFLSLLT